MKVQISSRSRAGITLMELVLLMCIVALLAMVITPVIKDLRSDGQRTQGILAIQAVESYAAQTYDLTEVLANPRDLEHAQDLASSLNLGQVQEVHFLGRTVATSKVVTELPEKDGVWAFVDTEEVRECYGETTLIRLYDVYICEATGEVVKVYAGYRLEAKDGNEHLAYTVSLPNQEQGLLLVSGGAPLVLGPTPNISLGRLNSQELAAFNANQGAFDPSGWVLSARVDSFTESLVGYRGENKVTLAEGVKD